MCALLTAVPRIFEVDDDRENHQNGRKFAVVTGVMCSSWRQTGM